MNQEGGTAKRKIEKNHKVTEKNTTLQCEIDCRRLEKFYTLIEIITLHIAAYVYKKIENFAKWFSKVTGPDSKQTTKRSTHFVA